MPMQSRFLSQLDVLSERLFEKRGGQIGKRLQSIMADMSQVRMHFFGGVGGGDITDLYTSDGGKDSNSMTCSAYFP